MDHDVSALPVVDERDVLAGIVTESDLLVRAEFTPGRPNGKSHKAEILSKLRATSPLTAADVMTSSLVTVKPEDTLTGTARLMRTRQLRRLPVVDRAGALVGMVSQVDLLKVYFRSEETLEWDVRDVLKRRLAHSAAVKMRIADGVVHFEGLAPSSPETDRLVAAVDSLPGVVAVEIA